MTPAARLAAAAEIYAEVLAGARPADRILHDWAKGRRYAGSGDRRRIRALVYDTLRDRARLRWELRGPAWDAAPPGDRLDVFACYNLAPDELDRTGGSDPYAPPPLTEAERRALADRRAGRHRATMPVWARANIPPFLEGRFRQRFGAEVEAALAALNDRAPLDLRVNAMKAEPAAVLARLRQEGLAAEPAPLAPAGIRLPEDSLRDHPLLRDGTLVPQDAASQWAAARVGAEPGMAVLDLCAGAGGKSLALAAALRGRGRVLAADIAPDRLRRIRPRAAQAGAAVELVQSWPPPAELRGRMDRVLVDAPCSGTGTWRRAPEDRWRLGEARLAALRAVQHGLLDLAAGFLRPGGILVYATCSLLPEEGEEQALRFLGRSGGEFALLPEPGGQGAGRCLSPHRDGTDGFYLARLQRRG